MYAPLTFVQVSAPRGMTTAGESRLFVAGGR